ISLPFIIFVQSYLFILYYFSLIFFFSSRRRHTISVSAFLLNRSSDLLQVGYANQIYARFDKNDWRIQPAEFYRFHDAEVNTFGRSEERRVGKECRYRW